MKVTKFQYPLENRLLPKLHAIFDRCTNKRRKRDAVLLFEGPEGEGKTTFSIAVAYYAAEKMKRNFSAENVFFDLYELIKFGQKTEDQIIIWDEPGLNALSSDSRSSIVGDLTRFLMMARKKRHLILINIAHFNKFNDYVIVDRPVGMLKIYTDRKKDIPRFIYIPKKNLRNLWDDWRKNRRKNYFKYASKNCRGTFADILNEDYKNNVLEDFDIDLYEKNKDDAIGQIGSKNKSKTESKLLKMQYLVSQLPKEWSFLKRSHLASFFGVDPGSVTRWSEIPEKYPKLLEIPEK